MTIGITSGNGAEFYVEDIRFHPVDALVTTTFYHSQFKQPVVTVDPNNTGKHISYDEFGRLAGEFRRDAAGEETILNTVEYNSMTCNVNSGDDNLEELDVSAGDIGFNKTQTSYNLVVDNSISTVTVAALAQIPMLNLPLAPQPLQVYS